MDIFYYQYVVDSLDHQLNRNHFNSLPIAIQFTIVIFLDIESLIQLSYCSLKFNELTENTCQYIIPQILQKYYQRFDYPYHSKQITGNRFHQNNICKLYNLIHPKLYLIRGFKAYRYFYEKDPKTWERLPDLRRDRSHFSAIVFRGEIYCISTFSIIASGTIEKYNPYSQKWKTVDPLPSKLRCFSVSVVNDLMYLFGGYDLDNQISSLILCFDGKSWSILANEMTYAIINHATIRYDDFIYLIGGRNSENCVINSMLSFDPISLSWTVNKSMNIPRELCFAFLFTQGKNSYIYVVGGDYSPNGNGDNVSTIERYNVQLQEWKIVTEFRSPRNGFSSCMIHSRIFIFGGIDSKGENDFTMDVYDVTKDAWDSDDNNIDRSMPYLQANGQAVVFPNFIAQWS